MIPLQCASCKNYLNDNKCKAYPDGIPGVILTVKFDHTKPYPGDNGIRFEPIESERE